MQKTKQGELAKALLDEYPTAGSLTLAKRLHRDYPEHFETVEQARQVIRYHRGTLGKHNRKQLADPKHVKDLELYLKDKFSLPEAAVKSNEPYTLPKINRNILVIGDLHFPYQHNQLIYEFIEFGIKKEIDTIILNGDCVDMYQLSRFIKDGRKPQVDYELELFWQFLVNLRETFPKALIIWKFGNHEERWDNYLKINAPLLYMTGTGALDDYFPLGDLNVQVVKDKRRIIAGDLNILHGHEYYGGSGQVNPARAMFLKAKVNCLVNHFHRSSTHKERDLNGNVIKTFSLGAGCVQQDYSPYGNQDNSFGHLQIVDGVTYVTIREI